MSETKKFLSKILNSFSPNMPLKIQDYTTTEDGFIIFVKMYYGHKIPNWKNSHLLYLQDKFEEYTLKKTYLCRTLEDFQKITSKFTPAKPKNDDFAELI